MGSARGAKKEYDRKRHIFTPFRIFSMDKRGNRKERENDQN